MRVKIKLKVIKSGTLPYNYHHSVSAWFYKILTNYNEQLGETLHNQYGIKGFTFSKPILQEFEKLESGFYLREGISVCFSFSFKNSELCESFILAFEQNNKSSIEGISFIHDGYKLEISTTTKDKVYSLDTPIHLTRREEYTNKKKYIQPTDTFFQLHFFKNLNKKIGEKYTEEELNNFRVIILTTPIQKKYDLVMRNSNYIAVGYVFKFKLHCPLDLASAGYKQGFGVLNSQGFGFSN